MIRESLLSLLARRDVFEGPQDADDLSVLVEQRNLVGLEPGLLAIGLKLRLDDVILRLARRHDPLIDRAKELRLIPFPGEIEIRLADDVLGFAHARRASEVAIATKIDRLTIFPEDVLRDVVHDELEQLDGVRSRI